MRDRWAQVRIGDLADVFDGPHATPVKTGEGPWYLSISSLDNGKVDLKESAHLSAEDFATWVKRVQPMPGDTLFSYETRLGVAGHWSTDAPAALGRRMGLLRPKLSMVDPRFLTYAYLGPQFQREIATRAVHGATVDRILVAELPDWPIVVPPLEEQRRIAGVLGALDDLIDTNRVLQGALDGLRRATIAGVTRSCDGTRSLVEVADHLPGKYLEKDAYGGGGPFAVYGSNSVMGTHAKWLYEGPLTVLARIGSNCGALRLSVDAAWINNNASAIRAKFAGDHFWLHGVLEQVEMGPFRSGSGQPFIQIESLMNSEVSWPEPDLRYSANDILKDLAIAENELRLESNKAAEVRDELLPLLVSGRVRVRDLAGAV